MTTLAEVVRIERRFSRSARIDSDLRGSPPLVGYVMQASTAKSLHVMAAAQSEAKQGAYTWTGPYGGGKSSAALLVGNLVAGEPEARRLAQSLVGEELAQAFAVAFPTGSKPWTVVAVTGSRTNLRDLVADAAAEALKWSAKTRAAARESDKGLLDQLEASARARSGVLLFLDELGKLLEAAADGGDIHLLQDLAERSTRSDGRLVVVGILHQAFDRYAERAARNVRDDWLRVCGRYQDISFLTAADEGVALLGRAIHVEGARAAAAVRGAQAVAEAVARRRPTDVEGLSEALAAAWPLNPVAALLLGPISRQRFAQNERSVFGFLSSAEPFGFQSHLASTSINADDPTYGPDQLWDYLAANFGMALSAGEDGRRFSLAFEAIDRAAAKGSPLHARLTKAAAVIEFFKNGSGVALSDDFLAASTPAVDAKAREKAIADLVDWAVLMPQPRLGGYALFSGSDFDLETAVRRVLDKEDIDASWFSALPSRVGVFSASAKRHYFRTGALRTFEIALELVRPGEGAKTIANRLADRAFVGSGGIVLLLSDGERSPAELQRLCPEISRQLQATGVAVAVAAAPNSYTLRPHAAELFAIERVAAAHPQIEGDRIARREIAARASAAIDAVYRELDAALNAAEWRLSCSPEATIADNLSIVASALADQTFHAAPRLQSELLQRDRPSSNAMAALRELCHAMVARADQRALGFESYPAAMGLYLTVLEPFGLHRPAKGGAWEFCEPDSSDVGASLKPAWEVMASRPVQTLAELYEAWAAAPYGLKHGVMPVLALAQMLARRHELAIYQDGVFQTELSEVFVDRMLQRPDLVRLRRVERSDLEVAYLQGLAKLFDLPADASALAVAQALFRRFEALSEYARRTEALSPSSQLVRAVVMKSNDPETLLFDALPEALGEACTAQVIGEALSEAEAALPNLMIDLRTALAAGLGVQADTFEGVAERARSIRGLTNDWAFEALAMRTAALETGAGDFESLAGLLLHRPPSGWSDRDREEALSEIARIARRFRDLEAAALVRGRKSQSEALAVVVGVDPTVRPLLASFTLTPAEQERAEAVAVQIRTLLGGMEDAEAVQLGALARALQSVVPLEPVS